MGTQLTGSTALPGSSSTTKTVVSVDESATAIVTTYSDGSTEITYKNQPIVDPECRNISTADINNGLVCQYNIGVQGKADYFEYRYIPTERWTKQVQSAGELRANMDRAAALNASYPDSARWNIYYNNPSWHAELNGNLAKLATYAASYVPRYIGETTTSGGAQVFVKDESTGTLVNTTDISDPNAPIPGTGGKTITDLIYPDGQPPVSPITPTTTIPQGGTVGGGTPIAGPLGSAPGTIPIVPPRPPTVANVAQMVQAAASTDPNAGVGKYALWIIGGLIVWAIFG